ncbi:hypothetical protein AB0M36_17180 [Actinoplanes sp. NPDC051346]|uniref:glycoside hydrolase family protein n=1 Tax=Actinoplanes sp. NPDC051346 TaxID=3155048 RepID=UPI00343352BD
MTRNRFAEMSDYLERVPASAGRGARTAVQPRVRYGRATAQSISRTMASTDRALVVLLDNGGLDLGLPALVDTILRELPGAGLIPESVKRDAVSWLRQELKKVTDNLLETAELALARYEQAKPALYADVTVLRNSTSLANDLKTKLFALARAGKIIDLYVLTHGGERTIAINDGGADIDDTMIRGWKTEFAKALPLRTVYMMNCYAATLNQAWLDAGAQVVSGSVGLNVLPEPTTFFFWNNWKAGQGFDTAITTAYHRTVGLINEALRSVLSKVPVIGGGLGSSIDVSALPAIRSSAPVVKGQGGLTIASDALSFGTSAGATSLVTMVVPLSDLTLDGPVAVNGSTRAVSPAGLEFIRRWEQGVDVEQRAADAAKVLTETVSVPLNQNQVDALACFMLGIGMNAFRASTLVRLLRDGAHAQIPTELNKWVRARRGTQVVQLDELVQRRQAEADLYQRSPDAPVLTQSLYEGGGSLAVPLGHMSYQQILPAIALVDAIQIGLGAISVAQAGLSAASGSLSLTYDKAHRLLTDDARREMPGARAATSKHRRTFLSLQPGKALQANAELIVEWEGNAYGEVGTVILSRDLTNSSDWTHSDAAVTVTRMNTIPPSGSDPRTWPIVYRYEGAYNPVGNGKWEFDGEFEINAFGGFKVNRHLVVSRSAVDFMISQGNDFYVKKGTDYVPDVPPLPAEQLEYLRKHTAQ